MKKKVKVSLIVVCGLLGLAIAALAYWQTVKFYYTRGVEDLKLGQKAVDDFSLAVKLNPVYAEAFNRRGFAKHKLNKYAKAIEDYNEAIELNPGYAEAYNNRGQAKELLYQYQSAIKDYDNAIKLNPNYAKAYGNRGYVKYQLGQDQNGWEVRSSF